MIVIKPLNAIHLKGDKENIADNKQHLEQHILKKVLRTFFKLKRRTYYLFQRIKYNEQSNNNVVGVNGQQFV